MLYKVFWNIHIFVHLWDGSRAPWIMRRRTVLYLTPSGHRMTTARDVNSNNVIMTHTHTHIHTHTHTVDDCTDDTWPGLLQLQCSISIHYFNPQPAGCRPSTSNIKTHDDRTYCDDITGHEMDARINAVAYS